MMVQPTCDDIYLCDNCDAEFVGLANMKVLILNVIRSLLKLKSICHKRYSTNIFLFAHLSRNMKKYAANKNMVVVVAHVHLHQTCLESNPNYNRINFWNTSSYNRIRLNLNYPMRKTRVLLIVSLDEHLDVLEVLLTSLDLLPSRSRRLPA